MSGSQSWERDRLGAQPGLTLRGLHLSSAASGAAGEILHLKASILTGFHLLPLGFRNNYLHFYVSILTGWCNCCINYSIFVFIRGRGGFIKSRGP